MYRLRRDRKRYQHQRRIKPKACQLCEVAPKQIIKPLAHFIVIKNIFPYGAWDHRKVADHLLIFPKRHIDSLAKLTGEECQELVKAMAEFEGSGYNVYSRAPTNKTKSVEHQHTHLIKAEGKELKQLFYNKKPYVVWYR